MEKLKGKLEEKDDDIFTDVETSQSHVDSFLQGESSTVETLTQVGDFIQGGSSKVEILSKGDGPVEGDSSKIEILSKGDGFVEGDSSKVDILSKGDDFVEGDSSKVEILSKGDDFAEGDSSKVDISKAQGLKEEGNKLFQKRDYVSAMVKYGEAVELLPKGHEEVSHIRAYIASCYMQLVPCEYEKAIHELDLALEVSPDHSKALLKRARCYEALNKLDLALKDVCMVSKLDPKNPMASEIAEKLRRTLDSKGLRINDSVIELRPDYVEPVQVSPAMWAEQCKRLVRKKKERNQVEEKNGSDNAEFEQKKNNFEAEKGKELIINKQSEKAVKGKQWDKSKEQEKAIIEEKLLDESTEDVKKTVKFVYSEDVRLATLPLHCTLFRLREIVHERFPGLRAVQVKYKDQEGDLVTITTDEELRMNVVSAKSPDTMRFYVVEVSPEQDPFYGRLVEMKKLKITADSFKTKINRYGPCKIEDWMIEFARLFKIQAKIDSDTYLNLQELGMKLNSEAMEEVVTSDEAQAHFDRAAQQFQEVAVRALLKLGNVHMSGARKNLSLLRDVSGESVSEQVKTAYECARKEHGKAKEKYEEAIKIKPDLFEVFMALGLQQFEEARLSWYYVLVTHIDLETWSYTVVVQLYENAERNIKKSMEALKYLEPEEPGGSSTPDNKAAQLKSWLDLLLCAVLYERSIMEYKLNLPIWGETLEAAIEKFELTGTCRGDNGRVVSEDYVGDNTLRDQRLQIEGIIEIYNEIYEAKQWKNEIPSDKLEEILTRRTRNIFHVSDTGTQRG